ncbi:HPP family protein [Flavobacterium beibuense]|uniref:Membrane protein, HPP family n=1 Tax=Flavobacterium beibuense TaxID=657326 RepID=A0A444WEE6_9FLAO|nr:HPP family protein [Flavobacterium beibuense]RYJ44218.1 Membrane protein, HPP family [Flavobacterium beibuense]
MPIQKMKKGYRKARYIVYRETLIDKREHFWAFLGAFAGMGIISWLQYLVFPEEDYIFLIGSFGASCVLVYGIIQSPLAQPRNLIGGHLVAATIGVTVQKLLPVEIWIAAPLSVALSIIAMQMTKTLHPPGGATALIAVTGSQQLKELGYWYVISPVLSGTLILLGTAYLFNNIPHNRQYPAHDKPKFYKNIRKRVKDKTNIK